MTGLCNGKYCKTLKCSCFTVDKKHCLVRAENHILTDMHRNLKHCLTEIKYMFNSNISLMCLSFKPWLNCSQMEKSNWNKSNSVYELSEKSNIELHFMLNKMPDTELQKWGKFHLLHLMHVQLFFYYKITHLLKHFYGPIVQDEK